MDEDFVTHKQFEEYKQGQEHWASSSRAIHPSREEFQTVVDRVTHSEAELSRIAGEARQTAEQTARFWAFLVGVIVVSFEVVLYLLKQ